MRAAAATVYATASGLRARLLRRLELIAITATLHWAEQDRDLLELEVRHGPERLRQMNRDIERMRVQQVLLRNS